jgi:tRNA(Phe) wybutosine-synthesizing methylase Tyw3
VDKMMLAVLANVRRFVDTVTTASSVGRESMVVDGKSSTQGRQKFAQSSREKEKELTRKEGRRIDCAGEGDVRDHCHSAAATHPPR